MALFGSKRIYLDYASATPLDPVAARAVHEASQLLGNPGAIHQEGVAAQVALDESRERIARHFGVKPRELIFTSGGTEANNLAILGVARKRTLSGKTLEGTHWIVSGIEHPSVLACFGEIERLGGVVSFADCDEKGIVRPETIKRLLKRETMFVSVGWANNETGVVQPIAQIAGMIRAHEHAHKTEVLFHTDAGQAPLYLASTIHSLRVDLVTLDSAKLYGPRGIGALYLCNRVAIAPIILGGAQERGLRPGTENVALAAGFAEALAQASTLRIAETKRLKELRSEFLSILKSELPDMLVNGDLAHALPHMLNISLPNIQSEYLTLALDHAGIAISTKSACREGEERRSHVVEAITAAAGVSDGGGPAWRSENTLRFSMGRETSKQDLRRAAQVLLDLMHKNDSQPVRKAG